MSEKDYAERAARVLREVRARIGPQRSVDPEPAIDRVADAIRAVASRRRRRRLGLSVAAAGALCAGTMAVFAAMRGQPVVTPPVAAAPARPVESAFVAVGDAPATLVGAGGEPRPLAGAERWNAGDRLRSGSGTVELDGGDGTSLKLAAGSDLQLLRADAERWLRLATGAVSVHVAKLQPGQRFVIVTPDAEVEVRGTRFRVEVGDEKDGCGTVTRVHVQEGIVDVRAGASDVRVPAGGRWPAACAPAPIAAAPRPAVKPAHLQLARTVVKTPRAEAEVLRTSTLATENDLFGSALRAEHHGDRREAIELLDVLLTRFPTTPLRASALAARDRLSQAEP